MHWWLDLPLECERCAAEFDASEAPCPQRADPDRDDRWRGTCPECGAAVETAWQDWVEPEDYPLRVRAAVWLRQQRIRGERR